MKSVTTKFLGSDGIFCTTLPIISKSHVYITACIISFQANMELTRRQLRVRNAIEAPQRAHAVIERTKMQWRYVIICVMLMLCCAGSCFCMLSHADC